MGYNLAIGEAEVDWSEDMVRIDAVTVKLDEAPAFGEPTDHTNTRWPSYTSWSNFCKAMDITDIMVIMDIMDITATDIIDLCRHWTMLLLR